MQHSTTFNTSGAPRSRTAGIKRVVVLIALAVAAGWAAYAYAQEAYLGHRLAQQVSDLRRQNAVIASQNQGYHRDIQAITSGAANEEEARLNGYSRPQEHVYLVASPPSPTPPSPTPAAHASPAASTP